MTASTPGQLYRLRAGGRVWENLSVALIIKNIRNGKLKPDHEIARAGSESWTRLDRVPQLASIFTEVTGIAPAAVHAAQPVATTYEVGKGEEVIGPLPRTRLIELIRTGELQETDRVRLRGAQEWEMAGDLDDLRRYFDLRRGQIQASGFGALAAADQGPPFYVDLAAPFVFFGKTQFLINLIAIMSFFFIAQLVQVPIVAGPLTLLTSLYLFAYYFRVVGTASVGGKKFPEFTDISDFTGGLMRPAAQFFLTHVVSLLPLLGYLLGYKLSAFDLATKAFYGGLVFANPWMILIIPVPSGFETISQTIPSPDGQGEITLFEYVQPSGMEFLFTDIFVWLALIFWLIYVPIALMRQASYGETMPPFNLLHVFLSITRSFGPYLMLIVFNLLIDAFVASVMVLLIFIMGLSMLGPAGEGAALVLNLPMGMTMQALGICGTFFKMFFIGRFLHQNSERMGWH